MGGERMYFVGGEAMITKTRRGHGG